MLRPMAATASMAFMMMARLASAAEMPPAQSSLMSVKIGVADFQRAIDFYVTYFGMKPGPKYNDGEWGLDWPTAGQGSNLVLVRDPSGKMKPKPGEGWLMFKVPDARKTAKAMTDAGIAGVEPPQEIKQYQTVVVNAHDPDGNAVEMLQVGPAR